MPPDKKDDFRVIISIERKGLVSRKTVPVKLRGGIPDTLNMSEDKIVKQLEDLRLAEQCRPTQVVAGIEKAYDQHKRIIMQERPDDFDEARVREKILEEQILLANEKNAKKRRVIEENINIWSAWYKRLSLHQEDAIYIRHPESYVAIWITGSHHFAVRHGLGGTFCVMEVTKEATTTILTHRAYSGIRYRGSGFALIAKFDRREVVESTTFEKVRKVGHGKWLVVDSNGLGVEVSDRWVLDDTNIPLVCYNEAMNRYKCGDMSSVIIPPGSSSCTGREVCHLENRAAGGSVASDGGAGDSGRAGGVDRPRGRSCPRRNGSVRVGARLDRTEESSGTRFGRLDDPDAAR